jgi:hypothetical protein
MPGSALSLEGGDPAQLCKPLPAPNMSLELTPTVAPKNRFVRGVGFESMIEWGGERSSARSR